MLAGSAFVAVIFLSSSGYFRHVNIFFPEVIQATVAFKDMDGQIKVVGVKGNLGVNPILIARTDSTYVLTVTNQDQNHKHQFYIDGLNLDTKLLNPGESDIITIQEFKEGIYGYYDITPENRTFVNTFKIVKVGGS